MKLDFRYLYTERNGRVDRASFWLAGLILVAIYAIVKNIAGLLTVAFVSLLPQQAVQAVAFVFAVFVPLAFIYPAYCLLVKRGHDREHPALIVQALTGFVAIIYLVPKLIFFFNSQEGAKATLQSLSSGFWVIYLLLAVAASYVLYEYGLRSGSKGKNRFGETP
jgi:uncharacterized membrane protein YhaH (DUF805 family)